MGALVYVSELERMLDGSVRWTRNPQFEVESTCTSNAPAATSASCLSCQSLRSSLSAGAVQIIQGCRPTLELKFLTSLQLGESRSRGSRMMGRGSRWGRPSSRAGK